MDSQIALGTDQILVNTYLYPFLFITYEFLIQMMIELDYELDINNIEMHVNVNWVARTLWKGCYFTLCFLN